MRFVHRSLAVAWATVLVATTALVHGALIGAAAAAHLAHHDHDKLDHDAGTAIEMIVHGHDHEPGTPEHRHSLVTAPPAPQHLTRFDLPDFPAWASHAVRVSSPTILRSLRRQPELSGPSPPSLSQSLVVLRI